MKKIQILIDKLTGKVISWGTGDCGITSNNTNTIIKDVSDSDYEKSRNSDYSVDLVDDNIVITEYPNSRTKREQIKTDIRNVIKDKIKNGTATQKDLEDAILTLI